MNLLLMKDEVGQNLSKIGVVGGIHQKIHNCLKSLVVVEADDQVQWKHLELMGMFAFTCPLFSISRGGSGRKASSPRL